MQNVREDRHKYIGGSDIPIMMNISPFKRRFDLLLEKAQLKEMDFEGNEYTAYGDEMEEKIRQYINDTTEYNFVEDKVIELDRRYHADGLDRQKNTVLEIKTTSQIKEDVKEYKPYLSQLVFGMGLCGCSNGILAVYERPEDFDTTFNKDRLNIYHIDWNEEIDSLWGEIDIVVNKFRQDLKRLKESPFLTEEELQPKEVIEVSNKVVALEQEIIELKKKEKQSKELKDKLKVLMQENNIKKWETPTGIKITLIPDGEDKKITQIDYSKLEEENKELVEKYKKETTKKGRSGYVRITIPQTDEAYIQ